jgi:hypothetical protein
MKNTPSQLLDHLIAIFPEFYSEWSKGESHRYSEQYSYHSVFQEFAPVSYRILNRATPNQIQEFCELINHMVDIGGELENAISTCFLEHASQIGVSKIIKPFLSKEAKKELR